MSDGRLFTSYEGDCGKYAAFVKQTGAKSSFDVRRQMISNADAIMAEDRKNAFLRTRCEPCFAFDEAGTMLPEESRVSCNASFCDVQYGPAGVGLGQGRNYGPAQQLVGTDAMMYPIGGVPSGSYDRYSAAAGVSRI